MILPRASIRCGAAAVVTRPGEAGQRLSAALRDQGQAALWWPAFDLLAPLDADALQSFAQRLAEFDLAVFVSPVSVRAWAKLDPGSLWPAATAIAGVGVSTLQAALTLLPGAGAARAIAPAPHDQAGSEGLWEALRRQPSMPRRVLIVRAEAGRDWLADRLREAGSAVEYACVYRRAVHAPGPEQRAALWACMAVGASAVMIVTSSEAVAALDSQLQAEPDLAAWLRQGLALASHPRVVQALQAAGYARAKLCEPSSLPVLEAIAGQQRTGRGPQLAESSTR